MSTPNSMDMPSPRLVMLLACYVEDIVSYMTCTKRGVARPQNVVEMLLCMSCACYFWEYDMYKSKSWARVKEVMWVAGPPNMCMSCARHGTSNDMHKIEQPGLNRGWQVSVMHTTFPCHIRSELLKSPAILSGWLYYFTILTVVVVTWHNKTIKVCPNKSQPNEIMPFSCLWVSLWFI